MDTDRPVIYLDIETTGTESERVLFAARTRIKAPSNYRDPDKIAEYIADKQSEAWRETALHGHQGRIACISVAMGSDEPEVFYAADEGLMIGTFIAFVQHTAKNAFNRPPMFCGFNVAFDLRWIWQRALINGIPLSGVQLWEMAKAWDTLNVLDLRYRLSCGDMKAKGTLKEWCIALGIELGNGDELDGADVPLAWLDPEQRKLILEHCKLDVMRCQAIHQRLMELGL